MRRQTEESRNREKEKEREKEEREKLASKAEIVHAGNTETTLTRTLRMQFRHSQCEGQFRIAEFVSF